MKQRYFQWVAGSRRGEVVIFDNIIEEDGATYINFKDGSRINSDLVAEINETKLDQKMMAEIESPRNTWSFKERFVDSGKPRVEQDWESQEKYEVPSVEDMMHADLTGETGVVKPRARKKVIDLIPPRPTKNKFGKIANSNDIAEEYNESIDNQQKVEQKSPETPSKEPDKPLLDLSDPVNIMMEKSKKFETEISMSLTISLPLKSLFYVAKDSFENGEEKSLEYIIENIDVSEIKNALKLGIKEYYNTNSTEIATNNVIDKVKHNIEKNKTPEIKTNALGEPLAIEEPNIGEGTPEGEIIQVDKDKNKKE